MAVCDFSCVQVQKHGSKMSDKCSCVQLSLHIILFFFLLLFSNVGAFNIFNIVFNVNLLLVPPSSKLFSNKYQRVKCVSVHFSKDTPCVWEELS